MPILLNRQAYPFNEGAMARPLRIEFPGLFIMSYAGGMRERLYLKALATERSFFPTLNQRQSDMERLYMCIVLWIITIIF